MTEQQETYEIVQAEVVSLGTIQASGPANVIERATAIATELAKIVDSRQLYTTISRRKYVRVEGWTTLGAMLGVLPREVETHPIESGYESTVELVRANDGQVIGRGSAICTRDEKNWKGRDEFAVRSMAITRATGKAYRLGFSWVMALAGYEATPAEEMDTAPAPTPRKAKPKATPKAKPEPVDNGGNGNKDGRQLFWAMYHADAKPLGIAQKHATNIAKKHGEEAGDWDAAMQSLADAIADKSS